MKKKFAYVFGFYLEVNDSLFGIAKKWDWIIDIRTDFGLSFDCAGKKCLIDLMKIEKKIIKHCWDSNPILTAFTYVYSFTDKPEL